MPESDSFWDSIVSGAGDALKYVTNTDDGGLLSDTGSFLGSAVKDDKGAFDFDKIAGVAGGIVIWWYSTKHDWLSRRDTFLHCFTYASSWNI